MSVVAEGTKMLVFWGDGEIGQVRVAVNEPKPKLTLNLDGRVGTFAKLNFVCRTGHAEEVLVEWTLVGKAGELESYMRRRIERTIHEETKRARAAGEN